MQERPKRQSDLWEQVWHEYDARRQNPSPAAPTPIARPERRRKPRGRALRAFLACCIVFSVGGYAAAPLLTAARLGEALASGDTAWLADAVDWNDISPGLSDTMLASTAGHDGQAATFLRSMADDVARGMATPAGMSSLLRDRLPRGSAGPSMIGRFRPLDAMRWEVALHAPGETAQTLNITLSLRDAWTLRWQVTGMALAERARDLGG